MYISDKNKKWGGVMMKNLLVLVLSLVVIGCSKLQTPYGISNVTVQGTPGNAKGTMVENQQKTFLYTYKQALIYDGIDLSGTQAESPKHLEPKSSSDEAKIAYKRFFYEGMSYSKAICTDYFARLSFTKGHRENLRRQTNIAGGLTSAILGLSNVPSAAIGGIGSAFSSVDSGFTAYDTSFLVTPNLGLLSNAVFVKMNQIKDNYSNVDFLSTSHVLLALSEYTEPCTHTGMQSLMDKSLKNVIGDQDEPKS